MEVRRPDAARTAHALWLGFMLWVLMNAWVSEDAYITLRVVDNFFRGHGLRWNVTERVQVYTHPLWLLLHIPLHVFIPNLFIVSCLLSVAATGAALFVTLQQVRRSIPVTLAFFFVPMWASKAFFDFTSSGLENALFYLTYAGFGAVVLRYREHPRFWGMLSLVTALALFNRLDTVLFFAPALAWLVAKNRRRVAWGQVMLGALPLAGWLAFSLLYYGFLLPNTKHAKLDTGLDPMLYLREGWHYLKFLMVMDIPSFLLLLTAPGVMLWCLREDAKRMLPMMLAFGALLYGLFVITIGGDYMMGRFWAFPVFACIWILYAFAPEPDRRWLAGWSALLILTSGPVMKPLRDWCKASCTVEKGRMDDGKWVFGGNRLFHRYWPPKINTTANHKFVGWGRRLAALPPPHAEKAHYIGMLGFYAGPDNILVDEVALADPLLSRLPVSPGRPFYIGHFYRSIPAGYIEAVKTGDTGKMDPSLARYYQKLRLITAGALLDPERLKTIVEFHLGAYDAWKYDYLNCNVWA